jgi:hypothetical protein
MGMSKILDLINKEQEGASHHAALVRGGMGVMSYRHYRVL